MSHKPLDELGPKRFKAQIHSLINDNDENNQPTSSSVNPNVVEPDPTQTFNEINVTPFENEILHDELADTDAMNVINYILFGNPNFQDQNHVLMGEWVSGNELLEDFHLHDPARMDAEIDFLQVDSEGDSEYSDDEETPNRARVDDGDSPLYSGAEITVRESMLCILAIFLKHNLTKTCLEDIIQLIELHCLRSGLRRNSLFKFKKFFQFNKEKKSTVKKHFFCPSCSKNLEHENDVCTLCTRQKNAYFIEMSIVEQLKSMYRRENFYNLLKQKKTSNHDTISDIYDGNLYKAWINKGFLSNSNNITFSWYTDGIPVFKSSGIGIWPLYMTINELPFAERKLRHNTLLLGLWYGPSKPFFNSFIFAFLPTLQKISKGIKVSLLNNSEIFVRGIVLMGVCDLPAKYDCFNFTHFAGNYGCPVCFYEGDRIELGPRSSLQIYPYTNGFELRTSKKCLELAENATPENPQMGVKGYTAFSKIMPDFIRGAAIDRMHAVDGGVMKKILTLLFDKSLKTSPFSLFTHINEINKRLTSIKPPKFIHRMPRDINELIHWKASELKNFMFYYSIAVFDGIMKKSFFDHYLLLIMGMYILSTDKISTTTIDIAEDFLNKFVKQFDELYGIRYSSINMHLLLHLSDCVRELGPLWAYTCYEYENINGEIVNIIHGTNCIDSQVTQAHDYLINMIYEVEKVQNEKILQFCNNKKKQVNINEKISNSTYTIGKYELLGNISALISTAFTNSRISLDDAHIWQFSRLLKDNKLFISRIYKRAMKTNSTVVKYIEDGTTKIGVIFCFLKILQCHCGEDNCECDFQYYMIIHDIVINDTYTAKSEKYEYNSLGFYHKGHESTNVRAVKVDQIVTPCVYIDINKQQYYIIPINTKEIE